MGNRRLDRHLANFDRAAIFEFFNGIKEVCTAQLSERLKKLAGVVAKCQSFATTPPVIERLLGDRLPQASMLSRQLSR
jgi:hypothetical protein